jgi:hypothetical protein
VPCTVCTARKRDQVRVSQSGPPAGGASRNPSISFPSTRDHQLSSISLAWTQVALQPSLSSPVAPWSRAFCAHPSPSCLKSLCSSLLPAFLACLLCYSCCCSPLPSADPTRRWPKKIIISTASHAERCLFLFPPPLTYIHLSLSWASLNADNGIHWVSSFACLFHFSQCTQPTLRPLASGPPCFTLLCLCLCVCLLTRNSRPIVASSTQDYEENGRIYHGFRRGMYLLPCDEVCRPPIAIAFDSTHVLFFNVG